MRIVSPLRQRRALLLSLAVSTLLMRLVRLVTLAPLVPLLSSTPAQAQAGKVTRLVVAFPPGGPVDFLARMFAEALALELGHRVIVENKAGGNGAIAADQIIQSSPDGSTLWFSSVGAVAINPSLYEKLSYDPLRDLTPVSLVANNVEVLVVNPKNAANSAAEFVAASKARTEPTAMASSGIGSIPHLAVEQLAAVGNANFLHVPYKGIAPAVTDLMGGQVQGLFGDVPGLMGHIRSGKLKAIGLADRQRHPLLPDVKTLAEQGLPGVDTNNWYALFASSKTPANTIASINQAVRKTLESPAVREKFAASGAEAAPTSSAELAALLKADTEKWAHIIRSKKIKGE
jgi:tripartite-type tricarboxylate transporter receptor subunit TctC